MPTVAAPVILEEMEDWVSLGGGNSGIVGNEDHDYGFHIGARYLPSSDYSRRRDPNGSDGPYVDWDYACAGDFSHKNQEKLRKHHRRVLKGLMAGKYPMICEFIGKPWADRPVYYWARWNGIKTLQEYTGFGHDHWSHVTWYRSKVDKRAFLWIVGDDDMGYGEWSKKDKREFWADFKREFDSAELYMGQESWAVKNAGFSPGQVSKVGVGIRQAWAYPKVLYQIVPDQLAKILAEVKGLEKLVGELSKLGNVSLTDDQVSQVVAAINDTGLEATREVLAALAEASRSTNEE